ncbi:MAG: 2-oxo acid dehydrogenase subunit E2 [Solirubrobacterales bacterium]|nr:2-oxo acid dehydrogenase subunit E2 [Solirubrobacterales bacterium]
MSASTVPVPDIGDFSDVPIIEILVSVGDTVAEEDPLVTLESDKATMDVPAPFAGEVKEIGVSIGDTVSEGSPLMTIEQAGGDDGAEGSGESGEEQEQKEQKEQEQKPEDQDQDEEEQEQKQKDQEQEAPSTSAPSSAEPPAPPPSQPPQDANGATSETSSEPRAAEGPIYASPSARRLARELHVALEGARGSGRKGRITPDDVRAMAEGDRPADGDGDGDGTSAEAAPAAAPTTDDGGGLNLLAWPQVDFERFGEVERQPRSRIQKISAPNLARNWVMIPHVTHNDEADITDLEAWRKRLNGEHEREGVKFTMVTFLVAASVAALRRFPFVNASLDGEELVVKHYYNIGFAADTPGGLVVPVIKEADRKGLKEIAQDLTELSGKARDGKLSREDMSGATFTISSLGGIGGTSFTPIINAPEVAILGVTRSAFKPVWDGSEFVPRLMVPLSLSYDHRVIDGAAAARFTGYLGSVLSDLKRALL